ncbi:MULTISPECIES: AAA family ATPase [Sorangium]|uniref:Protein kinase n=1 Tax=Sorangium cellulosum TaxID=56 RepID=A0A4P2QRM6_SORCE|nr:MULTISPECIES: AAA family ATPase [Sorangium]AUX32947.1 protein kinase [Sorangium cellulosum]WCQ92323.1 serine-threonine kinase [Sorangium sp. Soce836]
MLSATCTVSQQIYSDSSIEVFEGTWGDERKPAVFKVLKSEFPSSRELASLRHEYNVLRELDVEGVVKAYGLEKHKNGLALVLERPSRTTLHDILRAGRLELKPALTIARSAARVLDEIHRRKVIHKDVKPHNLLVDPDTLKVHFVGFGIATLLPQETQQAVSPEALEGTLAYMSPEQTGRMNRVIDRRTDLYSFGVTLYQMLTGVLPFNESDPMDLIHGHIARTPVPPPERVPGVPEAVSRIVMKLLAKNAEDRYQSAFGLFADLDACLRQLSTAGAVAPFALGQRDIPDTLRIPQKLYGRAEEERALLVAFERAAGGEGELLLVSGYSGMGKSALVNEIHKAIAQRGGYFTAGKFDPLNRGAPYTSLARAFRELIRHILTERPEQLARWSTELARALGTSGQLLVDLIPELEWIVGPQPPVQKLPPAESQGRFHAIFKAFVRVFATAEHPLVLFLDDLQWADPASLKLLEVLATDPERGYLLVIGAYRDNEVYAAHPLRVALGEIEKAGAPLCELRLRPLALGDVVELLSDALSAARDEVEPLARVVFDRTQSNPFFVRQFLASLHAEGLLRFEAGAWTWNIESIRRRTVTDNVVEFMARKIEELDPEFVRVLRLAACIGHEFDLRTLAVISERPPHETVTALWKILQEGLIAPVDTDYRLAHASDGDARAGVDWRVTYRFLHDRVQQAAYSLIGEDRKREVHLRIGRLMVASSEGAAREEALFDIVNHFNIAAPIVTSPAEQATAAELNLAAGRRAKAATAYEAAAGYFHAGMAFLPRGGFDDHYELALALHRERAEVESLCGAFEEAERLCAAALERARTEMDKVSIHLVQANQYLLQWRNHEATLVQKAGLRLLGCPIPEDREEVAALLAQELEAVPVLLGGRSIEELAHAPRTTRPEVPVTLELLVNLFFGAYNSSDQTLANLAIVKMVTLSLQHGNSDMSAFGYVAYGMVVGPLLGEYETAYRFGRMAIELADQLDNLVLRAKTYHIFSADVHSWTQPLRRADPYYDRVYDLGLQAGDWTAMGYMISQSGSDRLTYGMPLAELSQLTEVHLAFLRRARSHDIIDILLAGVIQPMKCLQGLTRSRLSFDDGAFDEASYTAKHGGSPYHMGWLYYAKIRNAYLFGDRASYPDLMQKLAVIEGALPTHAKVPEATFYAGLMRIAALEGAEGAERREHEGQLGRLLGRMKRWADAGPDNVRHKHLLLLAEQARVEGRRAEAMDLYEQGIEAARQADYINNQALGNELYGRFWLAQGRAEFAGIFLRRAVYLYERWGASAKVEALREALAPAAPSAADGAVALSPTSTALPGLVAGESFDLATVLRTAQAISSEIVLDKVLDQVLRSVIKSAGASRGFLILSRGEVLTVEAMISVDPDTVSLGLAMPLETRLDLARAVVHYVARSREALVIGRAEDDPRLAGDPHVIARRPKSILGLPLLHQGRLSGVLYLENHLAEHAFTADRIELLRLLSSQAAVAVENALLYADLEAVSAELRAANERLEREVEERTEELSQANERLSAQSEELRDANLRLLHELGERERAEEARAQLQEEVIRFQREKISELSTPLVPITNDVMVMPLIGTLDEERAEDVLQTLLDGAMRSSARVVIIDVTGLKGVDHRVANALINAANALRLLGTQAVLTGIRGEVAQALIRLDIDMSRIAIRGTLQSGIAYAIGRSGALRGSGTRA